MSASTSPQLVNWIAVSLRWLSLLGFAISLTVGVSAPFSIDLALLVAALWNLALTILAGLAREIKGHGFVSVVVDMLVAYTLFYLSGTIQGGVGWAGLLPLITGALYFHIRGGLLIALFNVIIQGGLAYLYNDATSVLVFIGVLAPLYMGLGSFFGYMVQHITRVLGNAMQSQIKSQQEMELKDRERRRVIYNVVSALSATLNYQRVLETALDLSLNGLDNQNGTGQRLVSAVLLFTENSSGRTRLQIGSSRRFTPADLRISLPGVEGLLGRVIEGGEAQVSRHLSQDPELGRVIALRACKAAYCAPLRTGLDTYGVLLFAHPEPGYFNEDRRELLDIIANQSTIAIQNARLYRDLEQEKERMMEIQEEARKKLARDLHDGPTQSVAAMAMQLNFARRLMERDQKAAAEELLKIEDLARRTTKEIRHMLFTLRPLVLESQGLIAALDSMAEKMHETYAQKVLVQVDEELVRELEMNKQGVIFYIAEEAVNNARKHSRAEHIWVRLKPAAADIALLEIIDDGVGFDVEAVNSNYESRGSLGMINLRERAELVNGVLQVESVEGRGTRIRVLIPVSEEAADRMLNQL